MHIYIYFGSSSWRLITWFILPEFRLKLYPCLSFLDMCIRKYINIVAYRMVDMCFSNVKHFVGWAFVLVRNIVGWIVNISWFFESVGRFCWLEILLDELQILVGMWLIMME